MVPKPASKAHLLIVFTAKPGTLVGYLAIPCPAPREFRPLMDLFWPIWQFTNPRIRENFKETHPIGTIITITHNGYTDSGKPRFARYLRKRDDVIIKETVDTVSHEKRDKVIAIFNKISEYEKANGQTFKANSYKKVITGLKKLNSDIELTEHNIRSIKGVGDSLFLKINDILTTGTCSLYEKIKDIDVLKLYIKTINPSSNGEYTENWIDQNWSEIAEYNILKNEKLNWTGLPSKSDKFFRYIP